jgi:hypothetical protein
VTEEKYLSFSPLFSSFSFTERRTSASNALRCIGKQNANNLATQKDHQHSKTQVDLMLATHHPSRDNLWREGGCSERKGGGGGLLSGQEGVEDGGGGMF